jgi:flagellar M-ring protein FliF
MVVEVTATSENSLLDFAKTNLGLNVLLVAGVAAVAAVMAAVWMWSQQPDYRILFANYTDRDGGAIVASLQQMNVPYKFAEGGAAILVPAASVHEARLKLAAQGLPKGGNVGFELLENQKLGVSQFLEQVNFQRALEGELATSIQSISSVQSARVHLALPKSTVFVREQQKPTASVLLNLYPGRGLDQQQVSAIIHLISSSVPELLPANVAIIDQSGTLLSDVKKATGSNNLEPMQLKYVEDMQRSIIKRIESIIAPIMGSKNVHAEATADVDFSTSEQAAEIYKPNQAPNMPSVRSAQTSESSNGNGATASGVPGALSNQPPAPSTAPLALPPPPPGITAGTISTPVSSPATTTRKESTTNYEVDKTVKYVQQPMGGIKRLSVAVVVNYKSVPDKTGKIISRPLTAEEKDQITELAKEAMGFNKERGDTLNVVNSPFAGMEKELLIEEPLMKKLERFALANLVEIGKYTAATLVLLYLFFAVMRPMLKKLNVKPVIEEKTRVEATAEETDKIDSNSVVAGEPVIERSYEQKLTVAKKMAKEDPRVVANIVKTWVGGNE